MEGHSSHARCLAPMLGPRKLVQNTNLQLALFSHNIPAFLAAVDVVLIKL